MKVVAFLPCRRGSQRVPDKNTRPSSRDGRSLLAIKLEQLVATRQIDELVYPGGRHEMLNEINRDTVTADIVAWLDRHVDSA